MEALNLSLSGIKKHTLSWNIPVHTKETDNVTAIIEQPATWTNNRRQQFMNYCLTHPEKFSCAVACFLELNYAVFKNFIRHTDLNEFFEVLMRHVFSYKIYLLQKLI